jgi:hypothetical protein
VLDGAAALPVAVGVDMLVKLYDDNDENIAILLPPLYLCRPAHSFSLMEQLIKTGIQFPSSFHI